MVEKKSNNLGYILGGLIIFIALIILIVMQVQNSERQRELQGQQDNLIYEMKNRECVSKCSLKWKEMRNGRNCQEEIDYLWETQKISFGSKQPVEPDADRSYYDNGLCQCEVSCGVTSNFVIS